MLLAFNIKPKQMLRLLCICLTLFVLNSSNLTMQTLYSLYSNGSYQFANLILQKSELSDSAYIDIESLRYLSSKNDVKAMTLLASHYQMQQSEFGFPLPQDHFLRELDPEAYVNTVPESGRHAGNPQSYGQSF